MRERSIKTSSIFKNEWIWRRIDVFEVKTDDRRIFFGFNRNLWARYWVMTELSSNLHIRECRDLGLISDLRHENAVEELTLVRGQVCAEAEVHGEHVLQVVFPGLQSKKAISSMLSERALHVYRIYCFEIYSYQVLFLHFHVSFLRKKYLQKCRKLKVQLWKFCMVMIRYVLVIYVIFSIL